jgi:hypothetical protein
MAECRGLAPLALVGHALVSTEARLACPVGIPEMAELELNRAKFGPRGRICTCNLPGLSGTPLLVGLHAGPCGRPPVPTVGFAPTLCAF